MKYRAVILIFLATILSSCTASGGNPKAETIPGSVSENKTAETTKPENETPESNSLNACLVLPKEEVEKILGLAVNSANLSRTVEGTSATAALSQCTYQLAGGQTVEFFARRSPVADNTPEAIEQVRETMRKISRKDVETVPGVGKEAFWVSVINQLHAFAGENAYLYLSMRNFKNVGEARTKSVELARQAASALSAN